MSPLSASAEVKTSIQVLPTHSQVYLVATSIVSVVLIICGAILIMAEHQSGLAFLFLGALVIAAGFWAWLKSQSDTDMHEAHATQITLPDGTSVITDGRTLKSADALHGLTRVIQEMFNRQLLPAPDGLVDENANIIPDSAADAIKLTNKINNETQSTTNALIDFLGVGEVDNVNKTNITQTYGGLDSGPTEDIIQGVPNQQSN